MTPKLSDCTKTLLANLGIKYSHTLGKQDVYKWPYSNGEYRIIYDEKHSRGSEDVSVTMTAEFFDKEEDIRCWLPQLNYRAATKKLKVDPDVFGRMAKEFIRKRSNYNILTRIEKIHSKELGISMVKRNMGTVPKELW